MTYGRILRQFGAVVILQQGKGKEWDNTVQILLEHFLHQSREDDKATSIMVITLMQNGDTSDLTASKSSVREQAMARGVPAKRACGFVEKIPPTTGFTRWCPVGCKCFPNLPLQVL